MNDSISVLVTFASAQGSTKEVATFIADRLRTRGFEVDLRPVGEQPDAQPYDAVVIGSAVHNMAWLPGAADYLYRHRYVLAGRAVWLFSVGLSPALQGPIGHLLKQSVPKQISDLLNVVSARSYTVFAGVYRRADTTRLTRAIYRLIGGRRYGDLRDWRAIERWTDQIAIALGATEIPAPASR
ncbi:flavodoxin domain-containing protein [Antrihabitans sp. YC2-6]|uniref:flavodoxin domain-containing protein n=1 Tax=Antrihabitans sp. YC2-6 TaxID=2799498 RepID=UPI0018F6AA15|nr:flavodoxin domain-containing protein [Antrihabitans sp. YC2-6]MBJ8347047.1 flavodoxin domain-containing protein [Antrihabitans sp. YC2-6]